MLGRVFSMPAPTTLIIADDHPLFRAALGHAVGRFLPDAKIVEAGTVDALEAAADAHPDADLILLDLRMPGAQGLSELMELRIRHPAIPVALVSAVESATIARKAIACGASGFIPKSASIEEIGAMLRSLLAGEIVAPYGLAEPADEDAAERSFAQRVAALTPQQYRVLTLLARGYSNRAIATEIDVVVATVKAHVTVILRKLGLERRTQAALLAQRLLATDAAERFDDVADDDGDE
jgi:DNA-binding NarL/FixJ family response regulator